MCAVVVVVVVNQQAPTDTCQIDIVCVKWYNVEVMLIHPSRQRVKNTFPAEEDDYSRPVSTFFGGDFNAVACN